MAPTATDFHHGNGSAGPWSPEQSAELYGLHSWAAPWLVVNDAGKLCFRAPAGSSSSGKPFTPPVEIEKIVEELQEKGLQCPISLHWTDILEHMAVQLFDIWDQAREEYHYEAPFRGVLPMKVNCLNGVAPVLLRKQPRLGVECGTLAELLLAIGVLSGTNTSRMLVVNGFKSQKFVETTLRASQLPIFHPVHLVFDRVADIRIFKKAVEKLGILPHGLGVRARLAAQGAGKHASSSGAGSKFGMSANELVHVVNTLRQEDGLLPLLKLLHFHIGSQVSQIKALEGAFREGANLYCELRDLGATGLDTIDVGGGLAIRYDNTSTTDSSADYDWALYARTAVRVFGEVCSKRGHPKPVIVTESGRALSAQHSMVIFDVEDTVSMIHGATGASQPIDSGDQVQDIVELRQLSEQLSSGRHIEDAQSRIKTLQATVQDKFNQGTLTLQQRGEADSLAQAALRSLQGDKARRLAPSHQAMSNVSYFQSLNHVWTLDGTFPSVPIQDLDTRPDIRAVLTDLTCDSLGVMQHFQALGTTSPESEPANFLPLHSRPEQPTRPYRVAVCFTGAYNVLLNGRHNLFGETDAAGIKVGPNGHEIQWTRQGQTVSDMLQGIGYDVDTLQQNVAGKTKDSTWYREALRGSTYPLAEVLDH